MIVQKLLPTIKSLNSISKEMPGPPDNTQIKLKLVMIKPKKKKEEKDIMKLKKLTINVKKVKLIVLMLETQ